MNKHHITQKEAREALRDAREYKQLYEGERAERWKVEAQIRALADALVPFLPQDD